LVQFAAYGANPDHELPEDMIDRARYGRYPPGSSFKLVTATAALRVNPDLVKKTYTCSPLESGRVGAYVNAVSRVRIRDDEQDHVPHGTIAMGQGLAVSCNAYFAQIGTYDVGAQHLIETAGLFGIAVARNNTPAGVNRQMPQASYGQGEVLASPIQMARVAAAMANHGTLPPLFDEGNNRISGPVVVLPANLADELAGFMRAVVTSGTGKRLAGSKVPIAGKTGTAEVSEGGSHAWFIGFAPYGVTSGRKIAFAVVVEHGRYGGTTAAPIAGELVAAARELGLI
jgi:peptidoglycan glycosyltransferase